MEHHPASFAVDKRDGIGAWIVCFAFAGACFGSPMLAALRPGLIAPGRIGTVAALMPPTGGPTCLTMFASR
jgi:hypothetical protein